MVLDKLGSSLRESLRKIARAGYVDKNTLEATVKEIQRAMLSADVNVKLVFKLSENIKKRAWDEKPKPGLNKKEHIVNIVYEEILNALGGKGGELSIGKKGKIMLCGLFGSGKTTTCAKLGKYLQKKGLKVAMISTDTWRPAAQEQLRQLGEENNIPVFGKGKDPIKILKKGLKETKEFDIVIVDSAGRDALLKDEKGRSTVDKELTKELKDLSDVLKPDEKLLVMPSDVGQKAKEQASAFNEVIGITGVILTKLDSTAKGGGALSACSVVNVPIKFVGTGEKTSEFEEFDPTKFVSKLLGMGDLESLVKKTKEIFGDAQEEEAADMMKGKFSLKDLYKQIQGMRKMGPLKKVFEMLPMGGFQLGDKELQMSEGKMNKFLNIMDSMTKEEMEHPEVITGQRVQRIAKGAGASVEDVRALLKQFNMTKKMMKRFGKDKRSMNKLMRKFGGKIPGM